MGRVKINLFSKVIFSLFGSFAFIKWGVPLLSRHILSMPFAYPVPNSLLTVYMLTVVAALSIYVTLSDERMEEFLSPVISFLRGEHGCLARNTVLIIFPLLAGWVIYGTLIPDSELPVSIRMQHPSPSFTMDRATMVNHYREPSDEDIDIFVKEFMEGRLTFIPQVAGDVEAWLGENDGANPLSAIPTEPVKRFLEAAGSGEMERGLARAALIEKNLFEGRALYAINCLPCHGAGTAGDGSMARGWSLKPVNFADSGTIETVVEGYIHWRVAEGGRGLPVEGTPWDSAMPAWKESLSEEDIWKVIAAEYDMVGKLPRQLENSDKGHRP